MSQAVLSDRHDHTLLLTINRPEVRNAVNLDVSTALGDALQGAEDDRKIRAVVLTGSGSQAFCAGADLKAVGRGEPLRPTEGPGVAWGFAGVVTHPLSKPLIAAVNGAAMGGGTEIVLACDLVVASEDAVFGLPEVRRGLIAAAGGVFRLPAQIPRKVALEMMLTGAPISAARAYELGLANRVVAAEHVLALALELAAQIGRNAPLAVRASKALALGTGPDGALAGEAEAWASSAALAQQIRDSADAREGVAAFTERRDPVWQDR